MKKIFFLTAFMVVLFFIPSNVLANVVINEVLYDPEGTDTGLEYIILYNNDNTAIDLNRYELNAVSGDYYAFPSLSLDPESFVIIHWRKEGTNTQTDLYTGTDEFDANMGNAKGWVALFNNSSHNKDTIIDYLEYGEAGRTWESTAVKAGIWTAGDFIPDVEAGKAIKLKIDGVDNNSSSDWKESEPSFAEAPEGKKEPTEGEVETPPIIAGNNPPIADAGDNIIGFINQEINFDKTFTYKYLYPGTYLVSLMVYDGRYYVTDTITVKIKSQEIIINEFIPNPIGKDEENEWIEIYNDSNSIVDISGWQLDDEDGGSKPFILPKNTLIAPKNYLVFSRQITKIALNNDKDSVRLLLPEGVVFQEINYEKPKEGQSSARTDEGFVWSVPTPGMANIVSPPKSIAGGEEISYQYEPKKETVQKYSKEYAIEYSPPEQEIQGGYTFLAEPRQETKQQEEPSFAEATEGKLATVKESFSKQSPANLILIIIAIILGAFAIGLSLVKFRKKFP